MARETKDTDTKWIAIRGLGAVKFAPAAPFLKRSLLSKAHFVRANAARALGEMQDGSAVPDIIRAIKKEENGGVIEQSALALQMLNAREAVPVLEAKAQGRSRQTLLSLFGAVEVLGSKADVTFFARYLDDSELAVAESAARAIERLTGEDFFFPKCNTDLCIADLGIGILIAQEWWFRHKQEWKQ